MRPVRLKVRLTISRYPALPAQVAVFAHFAILAHAVEVGRTPVAARLACPLSRENEALPPSLWGRVRGIVGFLAVAARSGVQLGFGGVGEFHAALLAEGHKTDFSAMARARTRWKARHLPMFEHL